MHANTKYGWKVTRAFKVRKKLLIKIVKKINNASRCKIWNYCGYLCVYTQRNVQKSLKYSTRLAFKKIRRIFVGTSVSFIAFAKRTNLHKAPQPSNNRNCRKVTKCHERGKTTRGGRRVYNRAYVYIYIYTFWRCYNAILHIDQWRQDTKVEPADKPSLVNQFRGCTRVRVDAFHNRFRLNRSERSGCPEISV